MTDRRYALAERIAFRQRLTSFLMTRHQSVLGIAAFAARIAASYAAPAALIEVMFPAVIEFAPTVAITAASAADVCAARPRGLSARRRDLELFPCATPSPRRRRCRVHPAMSAQRTLRAPRRPKPCHQAPRFSQCRNSRGSCASFTVEPQALFFGTTSPPHVRQMTSPDGSLQRVGDLLARTRSDVHRGASQSRHGPRPVFRMTSRTCHFTLSGSGSGSFPSAEPLRDIRTRAFSKVCASMLPLLQSVVNGLLSVRGW